MTPAVSNLFLGQVLRSSSNKYLILEFIGEGGFGKVAKCWDQNNRDLKAVKILKKEDTEDAENEQYILEAINDHNADQTNIVTFYEKFQHLGFTCLVFEMLDVDLHELVFSEGPFNVHDIRPIAKQLLVALEALKSLEVMHSDIKPSNIMLISRKEHPPRVKLIDFGVALHSHLAIPGDMFQIVAYRAPEVALGLPYSEAVDMWALGCSLAFLYFGNDLFHDDCEYLMMKQVVEMLGMPPDHLLQRGLCTHRFFCKDEDIYGSRWRLLTPEEFNNVNILLAQEWPRGQRVITSLDELAFVFVEGEAAEMADTETFIDFLKGLLQLDEEKRITPTEALKHPFITMSHLTQDPGSRDYLAKSLANMNISSLGVSANIMPPSMGVRDDQDDAPEMCDEELQLHPSIERDLGIQSHQDPNDHCCVESLDSVLSSNELQMEDVFCPIPTYTWFSGILMGGVSKLFSRVRTAFSCPVSLSVKN